MKKKPKITITYYGDQEPTVKVRPKDSVEIKLVDGEEGNWLFLKRKGVSVYHTETGSECLSAFWFSCTRGCSYDAEDAFDVRDLPEIPNRKRRRYAELYDDEDKARMAYAIDEGYITEEGRVKIST